MNIILYLLLILANILPAVAQPAIDDKELLLIQGALKNNLSSKVEKIDLEYDYVAPYDTNAGPSFARITKITPKLGLFKGKIYYNDNSIREVSGQYRAFTQVPVVNRYVKIGEILSIEDLTFSDIDITKSDQNILNQHSQIIGHQIKRNLSPGAAIKVADLIKPALVQAGEPLTILYKSNEIEIKATGQALKNASIGEIVKVKNDRSDKIIAGKVIGKGIVQINSFD